MTNETTNYIEQLRKYDGFSGYDNADETEEIDDLLYDSDATEISEKFREGGRWSNYRTKVYSVQEYGKIAYFEVDEEIPATEMQEGADFRYSFREVVPKEKTIIFYVGGKSE